jgi:predicted CDP-diglyceride synthetase/phosphatidate cytidylyltransferase
MYTILSKKSRGFVGILLASIIPLCYWSDIIYIFLIISICSLFFYELNNLGINPVKILFYISPILSLFNLNFLIPQNIFIKKDLIMLIVIFTQCSDIFQFIGGKISMWMTDKVIKILRNELSNFKLEFKQQKNLGFKSPKELSDFLEKNLNDFYIFEVSPNKTILGYIFGFCTSLIIFTLVFPILNWKTNIIWFIVGCMGDLYASSIKRQHNIKDFSNLLGAHGGFLDRFDSTLAVLHLNYWIIFIRNFI